jgi:hypothetical protein
MPNGFREVGIETPGPTLSGRPVEALAKGQKSETHGSGGGVVPVAVEAKKEVRPTPNLGVMMIIRSVCQY